MKELEVNRRWAEITRAVCVLSALDTEDTGSGEISGTKYMNAAMGFPTDFPRS